MTDRACPAARTRRRTWVTSALLVAAPLAWWLLLRPTVLGGPAGYVLVAGESMRPALAPGDLVLVRRAARYRTGEVIAYRVPTGATSRGILTLVVHRVSAARRPRGS